jgi:hypothetical protein
MPTNGDKPTEDDLEAEIGKLKEGFEERNPNEQQRIGERIADLESEIEKIKEEETKKSS